MNWVPNYRYFDEQWIKVTIAPRNSFSSHNVQVQLVNNIPVSAKLGAAIIAEPVKYNKQAKCFTVYFPGYGAFVFQV